MKSCSSALCVLVLLIITFTPGTELQKCPSPVKVKFKETATLTCLDKCPGVIRWTMSSKPSEVLAECDQTSCRSVKQGYQMNRDQYLKGDYSLIITAADFSMRGWYTARCDNLNFGHVDFQVVALVTTLQIEPGETLMLKLARSDSVEVLYNRTDGAGPSRVQICTVNGGSLQSNSEYEQRANLAPFLPPILELREMTPSDSGEYWIVDKQSGEVIHIYTVEVRGGQTNLQPAIPVWILALVVIILPVVIVD